MVKMKCESCKKTGKELAKSRVPLISVKGRMICQTCLNKVRKKEHEKRKKERKKQQERDKQNE